MDDDDLYKADVVHCILTGAIVDRQWDDAFQEYKYLVDGEIYDAPRKLDRQLRYKLGARGESDEQADTQNLQPGIQSESGVGGTQGATHD
jgi:hypothetical protein